MSGTHRNKRHGQKNGRWERSVAPTAAPPSLTVVRPPAARSLTPGTVVWAHVPFAGGGGEKTRPAVVARRVGRDVVLLPATSSERRFAQPYCHVEVMDLHSSGLSRPTGIRLLPVTVDRLEVVWVAGRLGPVDERRVLPRVSDAG